MKKVFILLAVFAVAYNGHSQSIVGKWKLISVKQTLINPASGKKQDISDQAQKAIQAIPQVTEFKANNTMTTTTGGTGNVKNGFTETGTYKVTGNQLEETQDRTNAPQNANNNLTKIIIKSITASTLVLFVAEEIKAGNKHFKTEKELTYKRL